jgi:hypothetical protein
MSAANVVGRLLANDLWYGDGVFHAGISGNVVLDKNGDREPDYWISDMDPATGIFVKIAEVLNTDNGARVNDH